MKKLTKILTVVFIGIFLLTGLAIAQDYYASINFNETAGNSYGMFGARTPLDTVYLIANGYVTATGLDTQVRTDGDVIPHMLADDKLLFAYPLPAYSSNPLTFYTGEAALASFDIIPGYGGYVTTLDAAALEPANNYSFDFTDVDIRATEVLDKWFLNKDQACGVAETWAGTVTTWISQHVVQIQQNAGGGASQVFGVNWYAQTFTPAADMIIQRIELNLALGAGAPAGDFTISLRNTSGGLPTGVDLTYDTVNANTLGAGWNSLYFNVAWQLTNGTTYAIVVRHPTGGVGNHWLWNFNAANPYAGGQYCNSGDSGATWAAVAANDFTFRIYSCTGVSVTGITAGEYDVSASADAVNLTIDVGGTTNSVALAGATVPNNASDWIFLNNVAYMGRYQHEVGGAPIIDYNPATYIVGTVLPDLQGAAQNGAFTWGTNPTGVQVIMGNLNIYDVGVADTGELETPYVAGDVGHPTGMYLGETEMEGTNQLFYFFTSDIANQTNTPVQFIWWLLIAILMILAITLATKYFNNVWIIGLCGVAVIGMAIGMTLLPGWVLLVALLIVFGLAILERAGQSI